MALLNGVFVYYDVTEWAADIIVANQVGPYSEDDGDSTHDWIDHEGFLCLSLEFSEDSVALEYRYVCLAIRYGDIGDLRAALRSPGWNTISQYAVNSTSDPPYPYSGVKSYWQARCVDFMGEILIQAFGAAVQSPIYRDALLPITDLHQCVAMRFVESAGEVFVITNKLYTIPYTGPSGPYHQVFSSTAVEGSGNVSVTLNDRSLSRIAQATEDLSMSRIEVSANNGDSMFNIVGGTRAASEE